MRPMAACCNGRSPMIVLIPITIQIRETAASLELEPHQRDFIRSETHGRLPKSLYHPELKRSGSTRRDVVGFLMYGTACRMARLAFSPDDDRHTREGIGKEALDGSSGVWGRRLYRRHMGGIPKRRRERLYLNAGFEPTGMAPWGEKTARLNMRRDLGPSTWAGPVVQCRERAAAAGPPSCLRNVRSRTPLEWVSEVLPRPRPCSAATCAYARQTASTCPVRPE